MTIPRLSADQYSAIFNAGYAARLDPAIPQKNPYDRFDQPREYRAWLRGYQRPAFVTEHEVTAERE
jgi:hypothetical protein